ncbi:sacsin-like [Antedon mediterranea]|uniref:sacsin-like n=1 Tax=Antedon mediterranea TaxID=105859 RepID=UPI003AF40CA2
MILQQIGFNVTTVPQTVYNDLIEAGSQAAKRQSYADDIEEKSQASKLQSNAVNIKEGSAKHQIDAVEKVSPKAVVYFLKTVFNPGELPCDITSSALQSEKNYLKLLEYIDKDEELKEGEISLNGIPLLLTQDLQLRRFSETDTYFLSIRHTLLPKSLAEFVHTNAQCHFSCKSREIKKFSITDLVERLPANLGQRYEDCVVWDPNSKELPNKSWIEEVWRFLKIEFENEKCFPTNKHERRSHMRQLLGNWSVLPVKVPIRTSLLAIRPEVNHYLMPFSAAESVLHCHIYDSFIKDACAKMSLPVVDESIFPRKGYNFMPFSKSDDLVDFIKCFIATDDKPTRILKSFVSLLDKDDQAFDSLNQCNRKNILLFFERFVGSSINKEHINDLQRLPCYRSIHDEFINLSKNKRHFVLNSDIPMAEKEKWVDEANAEFIKDDESLKKLYVLLGLTQSSEPDVYKRFILPSFHKFTDGTRVEHMEQIRYIVDKATSYKDKQERKKMIESMDLKNTPLISHKDQPLKRICDYFDDSVPILKLMLEPERLLPEAFCDYNWKPFMTDLGLQTKATSKLVLEFAHDIEQRLNNSEFKAQLNKSKALVEYIANSEELKAEKRFLSQICKISFLVPEDLDKNLLTLHERYQEPGKVGIAYNGALTYRNVHLAWTSASILPYYAVPSTLRVNRGKSFTNILSDLNMSDTPSSDTVLKHCKNIFTHLERKYSKRHESIAISSDFKKALHDVMQKVYEYFSAKCRKSSVDCTCIVKELKDMPITLVDDDKILIPAKYTVKYKGKVLAPYIHEIQETFSQYMDFFTSLGTQDKSSIWQCCEVLRMIHDDIEDQSFCDNPNLISKIKYAVHKIFKSYDEEDWLQGIDVLYLPNRSYQLMDSSTLKYYDKPMFEVRMKKENDKNILFNFTEIELKGPPIVYIKNMPEKLQPGKFSTEVKECMSSNPIETECRHAKEERCKVLNDIQRQLQAREFRQGIYRLLKHEANQQGIKDADTAYSEKPLALSSKHLTIKCLKNLEIHLEQSGKVIEGSSYEPHCFLERQDNHATIFMRHVDSSDSDNVHTLKLKMVYIVRELTGVLNDMAVAMMIVNDLKNIQTSLSDLNIQALDENKSNRMSLPDLGSPVRDDVVGSLNNDPFNEFRPGEYVVYELDNEDEVYVYAQILQEILCDMSGSSSLNRMYKIDYGKVKIVSTLSLYKWLPRSSKETGKHVAMELQPYIAPEYNPPGTEEPSIPSVPRTYDNLEETKSEVSDKLEEIWKLGVEERKKAIRRLYLKWHPDKNPGHEEFCTEVFKHLQNEVIRLEKGLPRHKESTERNEYPSDFGTWSTPFKQWNERARRDRENRNSFNFGSSTGFTSRGGARPSTPEPAKAKLLQREAHHDFNAASNDVDGSRPSYKWAAYKCLQAVEKSLKAAILSKTGGNVRHDIRHLLITVEDIPNCPHDLRKHVNELCTYSKDQNFASYQNGNEALHNLYSREDAEVCISNAQVILDMMDTLSDLNND